MCFHYALFSIVESLLQCCVCVHAFDKLLCIMLQCNIIIINMLFFYYCRYLLWFCNNVFAHALARSLYWPYFILKLYCNNCPYVGYLIEHDSGDCLAVTVNIVHILNILLFHSYIHICVSQLSSRPYNIDVKKAAEYRMNAACIFIHNFSIIVIIFIGKLFGRTRAGCSVRPCLTFNNCQQSPSPN